MFGLKIFTPGLIPTACLLCRAETDHPGVLCRDCFLDLPVIRNGCVLCGAPVFEDPLCGACIRRPPRLDRTIAACLYSYPVDALIQRFKYDQKLWAASPLVTCLLEKINSEAVCLPDVLLPVPLHRRRLYLRGYNQSREICRILSRHLSIPVDEEAVHRLRHTPEQSRLTAAQRRKNVRGAFRARPGVDYRSVAIVDDVVTTAATANEITKILKQAGVERVELWALARAVSGNLR